MDRSCKNCRFCIYAHSMRGKEEPYCERYSKWIGNTLLCSEWEAVIVPKPQTNADRIRAMTDEELAELFETLCPSYKWTFALRGMTWFGFLKQEVESNDS